ncbi:MAG: alanine--tRNA ligase [Patescibacteria group bacterium]
MLSSEIRKRFLEFFKKRNHAVIPSASLIPENDPSVLFTTAGMQPLVPYLLGERHPKGERLVNVQKCVRTNDIEEVGDPTHLTFFEMMGNWSIGDYFKKEALEWSFELLTSKEEGFGLDPERLYVTVFEGDDNAPRDEEAAEIWKNIGIKESRIFFRPASENWWSPGDDGPCGPDSEMFYDLSIEGLGELTSEEFEVADERADIVEIWNDVFMQYRKEGGNVVGSLEQKNVDTGAGLERITAVLQNKRSVFETDLFASIVAKIKEYDPKIDDRSRNIISDHMRSATFMISDGARPSNTDQGYVVRRLLRRAYRMASRSMGENDAASLMEEVTEQVKNDYAPVYPEVEKEYEETEEEIKKEISRFREVLKEGLKRFEKISSESKDISGQDAFLLFSTYGFPIDMTVDLAEEKGMNVDIDGFNSAYEEHRERSRQGTVGKFKGGLAGTSEEEVKYHTATHLLHSALKEVLGSHVEQKGSNITSERARFDFSHPEKMTEDEKREVERIVNEKIKQDLPVHCQEMSLEEAKEKGVYGVFDDRYSEKVKVYTVGDENGAFSKEICGGPHVERIGVLGNFKIKKEESVAGGVRRVKAILE